MPQIPYIRFIALICLYSFIINCSHFNGLPELDTQRGYQASGDFQSGGYQEPDLDAVPYPDPKRTQIYRPLKGTPQLAWPVDNQKLSQRFSPPSNPSHQGIDLAGPRGTPIYSAHPGTVIYAGQGYSGYGKMVILEYNGNWATLYAHFRRIEVEEGQFVKRGALLGKMGRTGKVTGVHLHFELLKNKQPVNPLKYLRSRLATN